MGAAYFYHLTDSPLDVTLPMLIGKARAAGWRVLIRVQNPAMCKRLDDLLWRGTQDGFMPHGIVGGPHDADQPVLLGDAPATDFACIMSVAGAEVSAPEVLDAERTCVLFDGGDADAVAHARLQWKSLTDAGCGAQYWAQEDGRWVKKAEKDPA